VFKKQAIDFLRLLKYERKAEKRFAYALNNGYNGRPFDMRGANVPCVIISYRYSRGIDHDLSDISLLLTLASLGGVRCVMSDSLYIWLGVYWYV
jgi:hypothetical protein